MFQEKLVRLSALIVYLQHSTEQHRNTAKRNKRRKEMHSTSTTIRTIRKTEVTPRERKVGMHTDNADLTLNIKTRRCMSIKRIILIGNLSYL